MKMVSIDPNAFLRLNYAMFHSIFPWCILGV